MVTQDLLLKIRLWFGRKSFNSRTPSLFASINNNVITTEVFEVKGLEGNAEADNGKFDYSKSAADADLKRAKRYEYVSVGLGKEDDFKDELTGRISLNQRGKFHSQKDLLNAFPSWCSRGFLVCNNVEGSNLGMAI